MIGSAYSSASDDDRPAATDRPRRGDQFSHYAARLAEAQPALLADAPATLDAPFDLGRAFGMAFLEHLSDRNR